MDDDYDLKVLMTWKRELGKYVTTPGQAMKMYDDFYGGCLLIFPLYYDFHDTFYVFFERFVPNLWHRSGHS